MRMYVCGAKGATNTPPTAMTKTSTTLRVLSFDSATDEVYRKTTSSDARRVLRHLRSGDHDTFNTLQIRLDGVWQDVTRKELIRHPVYQSLAGKRADQRELLSWGHGSIR